MKRSLIILIVLAITALYSLLGFIIFRKEEYNNLWFWIPLITLFVVIAGGLTIYRIRKSKPKKAEEKEEEEKKPKIEDTDKIVKYAENLLIQSDEPNYLQNKVYYDYTAGVQKKTFFGIVEGDGELFDGSSEYYARYAIAINLNNPKKYQFFKWDKTAKKARMKEVIRQTLDRSAESPKEDPMIIKRKRDPETGEVTEIYEKPLTTKEIEEKEKEEAENI